MRYPRTSTTQVRTEVLLLTGGIKEGASQLELSGGELLSGVNYQELGGTYQGYSSIPGYERFDGTELASATNVDTLNDYGLDTKTVLLLESNLQETIEDLSNSDATIVNTSVLHDPNNYKFLLSSFYFNGGDAKLEVVPNTNTLDLAGDNFTIDFLITPQDLVTQQVILSKGVSYSVEILNNRLIFEYSVDGITWESPLVSDKFLDNSKSTHVVIARKGAEVFLFFDGVREANTLVVSTDIFHTNFDYLTIGQGYLGYLDEIRISNTLRWVVDFDTPSIPYSDPNYFSTQVDEADREARRVMITPVPGAGSILGVSSKVSGTILAVRGNTVETSSHLYSASPGGWSTPVPGVQLIQFNLGVDTDPNYPGFQPGEIITGSLSGATATITGVSTRGGSWENGDALGVLALKDVTGSFAASEILGNGVTVTATVTSDSYELYNLEPHGSYSFIKGRFDLLPGLQRQEVTFFTNGVNYPTYYDGTNIVPIIHTNLPDSQGVFASHIIEFKNRLFLAYSDGRLWYSGVGDPLNYDTVTGGAGEIYMSDEITSLVVGRGGVLVVFCRNSIQIIKSIIDSNLSSGTTQADYAFFNETFSDKSGALAQTTERVLGEILYLDDRGVTKLENTDTYGDFTAGTISDNIQKTLLEKKDLVVTSAVHRENNQYRLFFSDKTGLIFTFNKERKIKGITSIKYDHVLTCFTEGENLSGELQMFFGSDDGYVYKMDSGSSFDGGSIQTKLATAFYSYNSPTNWKQFKKLTMETQAVKGFRFYGIPEYNYRDFRVPKSLEASYTSVGSGGTWGSDSWGHFSYGSTEVESPVLYLQGYGNNMSMVITSSSKYAEPHTLSSLLVEYSIIGRKM